MSMTFLTTPAAALSDPRCYVQRDSDSQWFGSATGAAPHAWAAWGAGIWVTASVDATASLRYASGALALGNSLTGTFSFTDGALSAATLQTAWGSWRTDASGNEASVDSADIDTIATDVVGLDGAAMRGTDSAALASVATETRLARLDAAVTTREASGAATAALASYDPPTNAEMEARTVAAASYATAANQTMILNRIGSFTGTGLNTIFGFFRAVMRKDASLTPSDVGGTYDNTTDSLEENARIVRALVLGNFNLNGTLFTLYEEDNVTVLKQFTVSATGRVAI